MLIWEITGSNLPVLKLAARSFDTALEKARRMDKGYNTGRVICTAEEYNRRHKNDD